MCWKLILEKNHSLRNVIPVIRERYKISLNLAFKKVQTDFKTCWALFFIKIICLTVKFCEFFYYLTFFSLKYVFEILSFYEDSNFFFLLLDKRIQVIQIIFLFHSLFFRDDQQKMLQGLSITSNFEFFMLDERDMKLKMMKVWNFT